MRIRMGILAACFCWLGALSAAAELSRYVPEEAFLAVKADGPRIWGLPQARRLLGLVEAANPKVEQVLMGDFASAATADYLAFAVSGEVRIASGSGRITATGSGTRARRRFRISAWTAGG